MKLVYKTQLWVGRLRT